ncbi:MAG: 2-oxo acid dehydrogenase subunit E2 [Dehalococcoidia bacterium]|nr:2-oxo acid dehydrogenase subunit E2 [Dehalococcoidia bacterium]
MPQLTMPNVGEGVTEGTVTRWLKHAGDDVALDEPVVEVETDKAVVEIPSPFAGRLTKIAAEEGAVVPIGATLAEFDATGEAAAAVTAATTEGSTTRTTHDAAVARPNGQRAATTGATTAAASPPGLAGVDRRGAFRPRRQYSPVVLRLAADHDIDLALVQGSGIEGRVTRQDVMAYIDNPVMHTVPPGAESGVVGVSGQQAQVTPGASAAGTAPSAAAVPPAAPPLERTAAPERAPEPDDGRPGPIGDGDELVPLTPTRRTIAARMLESQRTVPPAWMMIEADVSGLVALRAGAKTAFERREGIALTYMPYFVEAIVAALKEHPQVNSTYEGRGLVLHRRYDIGVAVAVESGLVVPVLRDADRKSIVGLAHELHELGTKARARRLSIAEMRAPTFTVDNTGAFGSIVSQPIVPPGQAAIITTEAVRRELRVASDGSFSVRSVMNLCISFDHRALDGAQAGAFMQSVRTRLEAYRSG